MSGGFPDDTAIAVKMVDSGDGGRAGVTIDSRLGSVIIGPATSPAVEVEHIGHEQTVGLERVGRQIVGAAGFAGAAS